MILAVMQLCLMLHPIVAFETKECYIDDSTFIAANPSPQVHVINYTVILPRVYYGYSCGPYTIQRTVRLVR
jgi:hypothetical protein